MPTTPAANDAAAQARLEKPVPFRAVPSLLLLLAAGVVLAGLTMLGLAAFGQVAFIGLAAALSGILVVLHVVGLLAVAAACPAGLTAAVFAHFAGAAIRFVAALVLVALAVMQWRMPAGVVVAVIVPTYLVLMLLETWMLGRALSRIDAISPGSTASSTAQNTADTPTTETVNQ